MTRSAALLVNLGSPASTSVADVRRYLGEFLSDPRVLDMPAPARWLLLHGVILPRRSSKSAAAYASIWQAEGSPLLVNSRRLAERVAQDCEVPVALAMRYGEPSILQALQQLVAQGVERLLVIPLYPHYAMSSYETVVERVRELAARHAPGLSLRTLAPFYAHPEYIEALVASAAPYLAGGYDHLLLSYHGLPVRHLRKADVSGLHCDRRADCCVQASPAHATCYRAQTLATSRAFVQRAGIPEGRHSVAYQSRLAGEEWLKPYTDHELVRLAGQGVRRLVVLTPAFVSDCLETLEEIAIRGRRTFLDAGGQELVHVPCLNDQPSFVAFLRHRIEELAADVDGPRAEPAPS